MVVRFIVMVILAIVFFMVINGKAANYLKERAIDNCSRISTYEVIDPTGAKVVYPVVDVYKKCLRDKGYEDIANEE